MTPTRMSAAIAAAVAVACQDPVPSSSGPPARPPAVEPRAAPADVAPAGAGPPAGPGQRAIAMPEPAVALPRLESFQLLSPGKGARVALRYALAAGTTAMMASSALRSRHLDRGASARPAALPAIRDGFEVATAAPRSGRFVLRPVVGQVAAPSPDADAHLAPWRSLLQGRPIALELDDRGAAPRRRSRSAPTATRRGDAGRATQRQDGRPNTTWRTSACVPVAGGRGATSP